MNLTAAAKSGLAVLAILAAPAALAQSELAQSEIDPNRPQKHFTVLRPAGLTGADAEKIYARLKQDLAAAYRLSGEPYTRGYLSWQRYNTVPYRSAQHGERFINNYANAAAARYRLFEDSGPLPPGAILVKDSFAVTEAGDVFSGPLFVMEKMAPGFNPASGDWRYTMIMPDGSLMGTTGGAGSARMEFCVSCHAIVGEKQDHMFYVPEAVRAAVED